MSSWKVIYVASRSEKKVAAVLEKDGYEFYLPLIETLRMWSDRKKKVQVPLFNGYIFVRPVGTQRSGILEIPGVVKFLRYNNADAIVTEKEIHLLRTVVEKGYDVSEYSGEDHLEPGEKITITQGPFRNYNGEVLRKGSDNFVIISFEQFGNSYKVKLPKQIIKRIA